MAAELSKTEFGQLGEQLVADWLASQGWQIRDRQWHSRWGELDIVATRGSAGPAADLVFVEVKTRSQGNWDADGLMAITRSKQQKLWKTAQLYLVKHPQWGAAGCRFDVALVICQRQSAAPRPTPALDLEGGRRLVLQDYIENAFWMN